MEVSPLRQFSLWTFHPQDVSPLDYSTFLFIQLKPEHHRLDVFNYSCYSVTVCICHAELKGYSLTYLAGDEMS